MEFFREKKIGPDPRWKYKTVERKKDQKNEQKIFTDKNKY